MSLDQALAALKVFHQLADEGKGVVLDEAEKRSMGILAVTHNRNLAERISSRIIDLSRE